MILALPVWSVFAESELTVEQPPAISTLEELARELDQLALPSPRSGNPTHRENDPERVASGERLYGTHCSRCHGEHAQGAENWHRRNAYGNFPPPPLDGSGHMWHHPKTQLTTIVRTGGNGMPPFGEVLRADEIGDIIAWFQSLWPDDLCQMWARQNELFKQSEY